MMNGFAKRTTRFWLVAVLALAVAGCVGGLQTDDVPGGIGGTGIERCPDGKPPVDGRCTTG